LLKLLRKIYFQISYTYYKKTKFTKTVTEKVLGYTFTVPPSVFNPKIYFSSEIFGKFVQGLELSGKKILDMGCGSGIISVVAASKGGECVAADINPDCVKTTINNIKRNDFEGKIHVIESNLFENVTGKFDIIFFNPPYYKGVPRNDFERAFLGGKNYEVIREFISRSAEFLNEGGVIYTIISSDMDINTLFNYFVEYGFESEIVLTQKKLFETFFIVKSFLRIQY
jgi:release factor glutamine methyltransferase